MDLNIVKEATIEYIENMYALGINYLKNVNNNQLNNLLEELELLEEKIKICNDISILDNYQTLLNHLINKIEVIINE